MKELTEEGRKYATQVDSSIIAQWQVLHLRLTLRRRGRSSSLGRRVLQAQPTTPLSALHDYEVQQAREKELELKNIRENLLSPEEWRKLANKREYLQRVGKDRIIEMGRKMSWKGSDE